MNDRKIYEIHYTYSDIADSCNFKRSDIVYTTRSVIKIGEMINFSGRTGKVINVEEPKIKNETMLGNTYYKGKLYIQYI